jgi:outer membrane lipoprotein LolB
MLLTLVGCATRPQGPVGPVDLPEQLAQLEAIKVWQVKGKMAIRHPQQSASATLVWNVDEPNFHFRLTNFLGITLADLQVNDNGATLATDDQTFTDNDANRLIYQATGWDIPLRELLNWIKGLPQASDTYTLTPQGLLQTLHPSCIQCNNWTISYGNYQKVAEFWLPFSITLNNTTDPNHFIKIRISAWNLH